MKTITFSNDQFEAVRCALIERVAHLTKILSDSDTSMDLMYIRDKLDVARQALDAVQLLM